MKEGQNVLYAYPENKIIEIISCENVERRDARFSAFSVFMEVLSSEVRHMEKIFIDEYL